MFNNSNEIDSFVDGIQRVKMANDDREFQKAVHGLCEYMKQQQMPPASWQRLDKISFYIIDEVSDTINLKNCSMAKERVVAYITELLGARDETDILINEDTCIEVKCSRTTMQEKLLGEQIKADMVHYKQKNIFIFIYDKDKIIKNPLVFKESYEKMVSEKKIFVIIHQPKML